MGDDDLFHLGRPRDRARRSIAWTGSANFTTGGFSTNEELMLEVGPGQETAGLIDWFEERWTACGPQPKIGNLIRDYRRTWQRPGPEVATLVEAPVDGLWHPCGGRTPRSIAEYDGYGKLPGWLYRQPWYAVPQPGDRPLARIWRMQAALLDAFVYGS